jgi:hypothetical protein
MPLSSPISCRYHMQSFMPSILFPPLSHSSPLPVCQVFPVKSRSDVELLHLGLTSENGREKIGSFGQILHYGEVQAGIKEMETHIYVRKNPLTMYVSNHSTDGYVAFPISQIGHCGPRFGRSSSGILRILRHSILSCHI